MTPEELETKRQEHLQRADGYDIEAINAQEKGFSFLAEACEKAAKEHRMAAERLTLNDKQQQGPEATQPAPPGNPICGSSPKAGRARWPE